MSDEPVDPQARGEPPAEPVGAGETTGGPTTGAPPPGGTEEEPRGARARAWSSAAAVPAVLVIVVTLLALGMLRGERSEPSPTPVPITPAGTSFLYCSDCHADLDKLFKEGERPTLLFTHERHFGIGVSDCAVCHVANTHEPDRTNRPTMVTCYQCHSLEEGARAPGECALCHPRDLNPEPRSHLAVDWVRDKHAGAALANPFDCATCHKQEFCTSCHGLSLPHPTGFEERPHAELFFEDPALCERCHPRAPLVRRDACDRCHHPQGPTERTWISWHPEVVRNRGAEICFQCHATETCRTCHRQGPEDFTAKDLWADRALLLGSPQPSASPAGAG